MRYYLDTEFNGHGGALISLALVREHDLQSLYAILPTRGRIHPWVKTNVMPHLTVGLPAWLVPLKLTSAEQLSSAIGKFLRGDPAPVIVADWPADVEYFCRALSPRPGFMIDIPQIDFEIRRVDAYPTRVADAVQHNAWWDAVAIRQKVLDLQAEEKLAPTG